jgi:hypothetical protein
MKTSIILGALLTITTITAQAESPYNRSYNCDEHYKLDIVYPEAINHPGKAVVNNNLNASAPFTKILDKVTTKFRMAGMTFAEKNEPERRGSYMHVVQMGNSAVIFIQSTGEKYKVINCSSL